MIARDYRQANFTLPADLLQDLRSLVPRGEMSKVVADALRKEVRAIRYRRALDEAFGAWRQEDHPELREGVEAYLRRQRRSTRATRRKEPGG